MDDVRRRQLASLMRENYGRHWQSTKSNNAIIANHKRFLRLHSRKPALPDVRLFTFASRSVLLEHLSLFNPEHGLTPRDGKRKIITELQKFVDQAISDRFGPVVDNEALQSDLTRTESALEAAKTKIAQLQTELDEARAELVEAASHDDVPEADGFSVNREKLVELLQGASTKAKLVSYCQENDIELASDDVKDVVIQKLLDALSA
jgi:hypothetical protein